MTLEFTQKDIATKKYTNSNAKNSTQEVSAEISANINTVPISKEVSAEIPDNINTTTNSETVSSKVITSIEHQEKNLKTTTNINDFNLYPNFRKIVEKLNANDFQNKIIDTAFTTSLMQLHALGTLAIVNISAFNIAKGLGYKKSAEHLIKNEGFRGLYKNLPRYSIRGFLVSGIPVNITNQLSKEFDINTSLLPIISSSMETSLAISAGELKEKYRLTRSTNINAYKSNRGYASIGIFFRNNIMASAIFLREDIYQKILGMEFYNKIKNNFNISDKELEPYINIAISGGLGVLTTPPDTLATRLCSGESFKNIMKGIKSNPPEFFRGAVGRGLFGIAYTTWVRIAMDKQEEIKHSIGL